MVSRIQMSRSQAQRARPVFHEVRTHDSTGGPSIKEHVEQQRHPFFNAVLPVLQSYDKRLRALEMKKRAAALAPPPQPPVIVQAQAPAPVQTKDTMTMNPQLAPKTHLTFAAVKATRDQSGTGIPASSRFTSEGEKAAGMWLPNGSAGPPTSVNSVYDTTPRATPENSINTRGATRDDGQADFAEGLRNVDIMSAAQNLLHSTLSKTRDAATRAKVERTWGLFMSGKRRWK